MTGIRNPIVEVENYDRAVRKSFPQHVEDDPKASFIIDDKVSKCKLWVASRTILEDGVRVAHYVTVLQKNLMARQIKHGSYRVNGYENQTQVQIKVLSWNLALVLNEQAQVFHSFKSLRYRKPRNSYHSYAYLEPQLNPAQAELEQILEEIVKG